MTELMKWYEEETGDLHPRTRCTIDLLEWYQRFSAWQGDQLRWRPVSEKPEGDGRYWCLIDTENEVKTGEYFFEDGEWWAYDGGEYPYYIAEWNMVNTLQAHITHWLPIPPAPEGE